jgi:uncharacterized protein
MQELRLPDDKGAHMVTMQTPFPFDSDAALSAAELDRLEAFLNKTPDAMTLEMLDGFLAALACAPVMVSIGQFLPLTLAADGKHQRVFADIAEGLEIIDLVMRHWTTIADTMDQYQTYPLILRAGEDGVVHAKDWAIGFLRGAQLAGGFTQTLLDDRDQRGCILAMLALAQEGGCDPSLRSSRTDPERCKALIVEMTASLTRIYKYFAAQRTAVARGK